MSIFRISEQNRLSASDQKTQEIAISRPEKETHLTKRPDRLAGYLLPHMDAFRFDEFKPAYLNKHGLAGTFSGVPVPLREEDIEAIKAGGSVKPGILAENMGCVVGINPHFKHAEAYAAFMKANFGAKAAENLTTKAGGFAQKEDFDMACIYFRASLVLDFQYQPGLYGYARVLRSLYNREGLNEETVGKLKAESFDFFEMLTEFHPRFGYGWYFLGYLYLNMGLYKKAGLAWQRFLEIPGNSKDKGEIRQRVRQIEEPIQIESGYNAVIAGRWEEGLEILELYKESAYQDWWPLWYYLGAAYAQTGRPEEAESAFKQALQINPRHIESMEELIALYGARGAKDLVKKYKDKIALMRKE